MNAPHTPSPPPRSARVEAAFTREEYLALQLGVRVRAVAMTVIAIWITIENAFPRVLYYYALLGVVAGLGFVPVFLWRIGRYRPWMRYAFTTLDIALLTFAVFSPNPFDHDLLPPQHLLRIGNELYLFLFIVASAFTYSPAIVLWTGVAAALAWSAATWWIALMPDTVGLISTAQWEALSDAEKVRLMIDPHHVYLGIWGRQVIVLILTAAGTAVFVRRARRLVFQQAEIERERANLSRYFSPNLVDELAQSDQPLGPTRQQDVAVLFADLVGFTTLAEALPPDQVIELLRAFHGRMERVVFDHGGTVDKYIGDAVMATFGTPRAGPADATSALRCARAMIEAVADWNTARGQPGQAPIRIGVGLHYGPVVLGDIGGEARLEYAVIGDTVNVASRLERLTRRLHVSMVVSDAVVAAVRREAPPDAVALLDGLASGPTEALRGREAPMPVWVR